jgi:hypothetical protein
LGTSKWLVQRAVRGISHCDFSIGEQVSAFNAMVNWEQNGVKPAGDEILDAAVIANPSYGCKFTDNTMTVDDSAATRASRDALKASYPCPAN